MTTKEYQLYIRPLLERKLELDVVSEWNAFRDHPRFSFLSGYNSNYLPKVDIAVGPFNTEPGSKSETIRRYNQLIQRDHIASFMREIYQRHTSNIGYEVHNEIHLPGLDELLVQNQNARCFIAFEIENKNSTKHVMGSLINAASLGRVGVGVAFDQRSLRAFIRIMNYLGFLKRVEKNAYNTTNFLIITQDQLKEILDIDSQGIPL